MRIRHRPLRRGHLVLATSVALVLSGCAEFDDTAASETAWHTPPELTAEQGPQPEGETPPPTGSERRQRDIPPPDGCTDHDPAVIATCLDTVTAVAAIAGTKVPTAIAGERRTGRVLRVERGKEPRVITELNVSAAGDGGLTGLALSPTYNEDQLVYAYITTAKDNRVVRFAPGQRPSPVLTGIPKGDTGNRGVLAPDNTGALLVATGDAGGRASASDSASLAGKVLRIDTSGNPAPGNPSPGSRVVATGLHAPGGVCTSADGSRTWVTDRADNADALYEVVPGEKLDTAAWSWRTKPGVAGCVDTGQGVTITTSIAGSLQFLPIDERGAVTGKPTVALDGEDGYGRLSGLSVLTESIAVAGTVNKDGGTPVSSDDRVVLLPIQPEGGGGGKD
ncbi:PQQ-dependent sugar dehydrogenase [Haloechinothrix salitolerans]|uniref:PQQ-dependent sugar dehydrogenase n=1 Tax=Haloechinothrix salitolerans TaxID=926830 RepID=A0ABW2C3W2_9PSEU